MFKNLTIGTKLLILTGVIMGAWLSTAIYSITVMKNIGDELAEIADEDIPLTQALTQITTHQLEQAIVFERAVRFGELMATNEEHRDRFEQAVFAFEERNRQVDEEVAAAAIVSDKAIELARSDVSIAEFRDIRERLRIVESTHATYAEHAANVFALLRDGNLLEAELLAEAVEQEEDALDRYLEAALDEIEFFTEDSINTARSHEEQSLVVLLALLAGGSALSVFLAVTISRSITRPIAIAVARMADLALGDVDKNIDVTTKDEVGRLLSGMNQVLKTLRNLAEVAEQVAQGKLDVRVEVLSKKDRLARSINNMVATLKDVALQSSNIAQGDYSAKLEPRSDEDELAQAVNLMTANLRRDKEQGARQDWLTTGVARISDEMRGDVNIDTLSTQVIAEISTYLGAQVGACYVMVDDLKDGHVLELLGTYAYTKHKNLPDQFKLGEGLVGQCALEKTQILVSNVPQDYVKVTSGLGEATPKFIAVTPFLYDDRVTGVIEIGSVGEFSDLHLQYLELVMPAIAISAETAKGRTELASSYEESQVMAEELKASNEELEEQTQLLESSQERLQAQQEELQTANEEMEEKNELLETQKLEVEVAREKVEEKAAELALASKYKSEFLANMSHELRTPLNSLLLLAQTLANNKQGNLTDVEVESARIIYGSGSDLLALINRILDLSKIESGRMNLRIDTLLASDLAASIRSTFGHLAEEKGLDLKVIINDDAPAQISTDRQRLEQVLRNLLSNAIKFTEEGGVTVTIGRPSPEVNLSKSKLSLARSYSIAVNDTGIGIDAGQHNVIFEAFQQGDGGTARQHGGTGLGLSISRELVHLLGGEIKLQSEAGKGSTFTIYLPLVFIARDPVTADKSVVDREADANAGATSGSSRNLVAELQIKDDREQLDKDDCVILIIEDDRVFSKVVRDKCHDKGFKCLAAPSGESGLELALEYLPSAVILDVRLPGISGWAVLRALKADTRTRHIPVHIVSVDEPTTEARHEGAIGHAVKPIDQEGLEEALRRLEKVMPGQPKHVLVVEDDVASRRRIVKLIGGRDVTVDEVESGAAAIEALRAGGYDCVVLDLKLPDMNGGEILTQLAQEGVSLPPIIIHTARDLTHDEEMALREHADSIVIKDVRTEERLLDEVSLLLHRVVSKMPVKKRKIIRDLHDTDEVLRDKKVLVVDDDMRTTFAVSRMLAERGMKPLKAEDGKRALKLLAEHPDVALVLMDIMMPVMDGYETMRRIRDQEKFRRLPIIALTAKAMLEDREKCLAAGANDYMPKPVDEGRLISMIRVWLYR